MYNADLNDYKADEALAGSPGALRKVAICTLCDDVMVETFNGLSKAYRACGFRQGWMVIALVAVQCVVIFILVMSNTHFLSITHTASTENQFQYQKLAQALLQGHFYLDDVPSAALQAMDNPYDTAARDSAGVPYLWDHAY